MAYSTALEEHICRRPDLINLKCKCVHCGILFLVDARNTRRKDLCCPFGCNEPYRKQQNNARSRAHYRTENSDVKKSKINQKAYYKKVRQKRADQANPSTPIPITPTTTETSPSNTLQPETPPITPKFLEKQQDVLPLFAPTAENFMAYLRYILRLVDGRTYSFSVIKETGEKILRQRGMAILSRAKYLAQQILKRKKFDDSG